MSHAISWSSFLVAAALVHRASATEPPPAPEPARHRWGVGLQLGPLASPTGHIGIPLGADQGSPHMAAEITIRYEALDHLAITGAIGVPHPALGNAARLGCELFARVIADPSRIVALEVYLDPGLQLGFAGPDYFARNSDVFVGHLYAVQGPLAFGVRYPAGLRLSWADGRFDTYVEEIPTLVLTPQVETFLQLGVGARARF